jgi:hypothetical protein
MSVSDWSTLAVAVLTFFGLLVAAFTFYRSLGSRADLELSRAQECRWHIRVERIQGELLDLYEFPGLYGGSPSLSLMACCTSSLPGAPSMTATYSLRRNRSSTGSVFSW